MRIAVVGLGKIGLPLATYFAHSGHDVTGVDVDLEVVDSVNRGIEPFPGEHDLQRRLTEAVAAGNLRATPCGADAVSRSQVVVVVVPLFTDRTGAPDFRALDSATREIARGLRPGTLVSYETTLPVGTTRTRFAPLLSQGSGLDEGSDFHVVFSPERVLTGRVFEDLRRYPKLLGGLSAVGSAVATGFYETVLSFDVRHELPRPNGVWDLGSAEAAELAKLAETTYRDVNIGLANQFAMFAESAGVDVRAVIEACNSQPYSHIHQPGVAVGGHCIPVYPRLYLSSDPDASIVERARSVNEYMPVHAVTLLEREHGDLDGSRVVVLGAAYRAGVKEVAYSGAFPLCAHLRDRGADVTVHDVMFRDDELERLGFRPFRPGSPVDAAVLHTAHPQYAAWRPADLPGIRTLVDGRGVLDPTRWEGVRLAVIGDGRSVSRRSAPQHTS